MSERRSITGRVFAAVALATIIVALYFSPARAWLTLDYARQLIAQLRALWFGPLIFILLFGVGSVLAIPASLFVISAGIIWGAFPGGLYALIGGCLGAALSFFVARFIGGGILKRFGKHGQRLEKHLETAGFSSMLVLRLVPLFPFPVVNYAAGVAGVRFSDFFFSTLLGSAPSIFVIAYSADAIAAGTLSKEGAFYRILIAAGLMAALVFIPLLIKRRLQRRPDGAVVLPDLEG